MHNLLETTLAVDPAVASALQALVPTAVVRDYTVVVTQRALDSPRLQPYIGFLHALTLNSSVSSSRLALQAQHHHTEFTPSGCAAMAIPLNGPIATLVATLGCYAYPKAV
jgi:hypothetical protein